MQVNVFKGQRNRFILISGARASDRRIRHRSSWLILAAERMGILNACREVRVGMREIVRLDRAGEVVWKTDGNFGAGEGITGDVEILRDELTRILQETACEGVEYLFGDSIASITQDEDGVSVTFDHAEPRRFDLIMGADGLHSNVRSLAFGPEAEFLRPLGYYAGIFTIPNVLNLDRQWYLRQLPGKMISIIDYGHDKRTRGLLVFASPPLKYDRSDLAQQKALIEEAFEGDTSWRIPVLLDALRGSTDLYFDEVTQVHMKSWSNGRVALLGDAVSAPRCLPARGRAWRSSAPTCWLEN